MAEKMIFSGESWRYDWSRDMLVAINAAKALGHDDFCITVRAATRTLPKQEPSGKDIFGHQVYRTVGSVEEEFQRVCVWVDWP